MRSWIILLGGLVVWAVNFFALYIVASVLLTTPAARISTLLIASICLAANGLLLWWIIRAEAAPASTWLRTMALYAIAVSTLAIVWQALPALLI